MWKLLKLELYKIFKRPRTYIAFGAIAAIVILIQVALKFDGKSYIDLLLSNLEGSFDFTDEFKVKVAERLPHLFYYSEYIADANAAAGCIDRRRFYRR